MPFITKLYVYLLQLNGRMIYVVSGIFNILSPNICYLFHTRYAYKWLHYGNEIQGSFCQARPGSAYVFKLPHHVNNTVHSHDDTQVGSQSVKVCPLVYQRDSRRNLPKHSVLNNNIKLKIKLFKKSKSRTLLRFGRPLL